MSKAPLALRYRTSGNYDPSAIFTDEYEEPIGSSITVPDQALTVEQLIQRHQRGQTLRGYEPIFYNDTEVPEIEKMDFAEKRQFYEVLAAHEKEIRDFLDVKISEKEQAKKAEELEKAVNEKIKQDASSSTSNSGS